LIAVNPVERQDNHDEEVRDQQAVVEDSELVQMLEGLVGVVRLPIMDRAVRSRQRGEQGRGGCSKG